jgi:hypothetical protein
MASKENGPGGSIAMGLVLAIFMFFAWPLLVFFSFLGTVLSLFAWNGTFRFWRWSWTQELGRAFVRRGMIGTVALPLVGACALTLLGVRLDGRFWLFAALCGYAIGTIIFPVIFGDWHAGARPLRPMPGKIGPRERRAAESESRPRFASWDDEEEFR